MAGESQVKRGLVVMNGGLIRDADRCSPVIDQDDLL
jgi:hypothetical protein